MALLVLRRVGLCVGQNQMCHLCCWLKLLLKNVRWEKIKIQKRWLLGRLSDGSFVPLFYVYFCRSILLCRLLGLQVTFCSYPKGGTFTTKLDLKNKCLMNHKTVFGTRNPAFWVGAVMCCGFSHFRFRKFYSQTYTLVFRLY
jgi:hypothetical protein